MPELPEVQTTANSLNQLIKGLIIKDVWTDYGGAFHDGKSHIKNKQYFPLFRRTVVGQRITGVGRRGKNVLINLSKGDTILVHMKMTGIVSPFDKLIKTFIERRHDPCPHENDGASFIREVRKRW